MGSSACSCSERPARLGCGQAREAVQDGQAGVGARPVSGDHLRTGGTDHGAQPDRDDDGVVGVADHGEEVGYQVDRHQEVAEQQPEPDPDTSRHAAVRCQPAQQPDHVREQPHPLTERGAITAAARHGENTDEREPEHQQATAHRERQLLPPAHTAQCARDSGRRRREPSPLSGEYPARPCAASVVGRLSWSFASRRIEWESRGDALQGERNRAPPRVERRLIMTTTEWPVRLRSTQRRVAPGLFRRPPAISFDHGGC